MPALLTINNLLTINREAYTKNTFLSMVQGKSVLPKLQANPTRVWDTFAEPNNYKQYRVKLLIKIRPHPDSSGPRPKSRLTEEGCD